MSRCGAGKSSPFLKDSTSKRSGDCPANRTHKSLQKWDFSTTDPGRNCAVPRKALLGSPDQLLHWKVGDLGWNVYDIHEIPSKSTAGDVLLKPISYCKNTSNSYAEFAWVFLAQFQLDNALKYGKPSMEVTPIQAQNSASIGFFEKSVWLTPIYSKAVGGFNFQSICITGTLSNSIISLVKRP